MSEEEGWKSVLPVSCGTGYLLFVGGPNSLTSFVWLDVVLSSSLVVPSLSLLVMRGAQRSEPLDRLLRFVNQQPIPRLRQSSLRRLRRVLLLLPSYGEVVRSSVSVIGGRRSRRDIKLW